MASDDEVGISRASAEGAPEVARLLHAFNTEYEEWTPPVAELAERVRELLAEEALVALLAGEPAVGLAVLRIRPSLWSRAADAYLEELYVVPERRRSGIGRRLLEAAIDAARRAGADHLEVTTGEADRVARSLYQSLGFTNREGGPDGPRMLYYELDL